MKISNFKQRIISFLVIIGLASTVGCRPSIHDVVKVLAAVPLGASRAEMWASLAKAYPKQVWPYMLTYPALPLTHDEIQNDQSLIEIMRKARGGFVFVYPQDLYRKLPSTVYSDMVGIFRETTAGGGSLRVIYDDKTNYIGFCADAYQ